MLVASSQRKLMFPRNRGNPDIVLWNKFSEPCQVCADSAVVVSCPLVGSEDGTELYKILNLPEALRFKSGFVSSIEKLTQSRHRQVERGYLFESFIESRRFTTQM